MIQELTNYVCEGCTTTVNKRDWFINATYKKIEAIGKAAEDRVMKVLNKIYTTTYSDVRIDENNDARYDLAIYFDKDKLTRYEVKDDIASLRTGNICLEFRQYGKVSGVFSPECEAEVLIYKSGDICYFLDRVEIVNLVVSQVKGVDGHKKIYTRIVDCGTGEFGEKNCRGFLIPLKLIEELSFTTLNLKNYEE